MTQQHPITPPPELVLQWAYLPADWNTVAPLIAQWGADQELEACCEWFKQEGWNPCHPEALLAARRPKPPSLKGPTDDELLQVFDTVCLSEGGTVDEIHLRGLRAVLARWGK
jgi:hypothetical protein